MFFKGFKYGANRFSIRGFLAAIFHSLMSSPCDAPGVFAKSESKCGIEDWRELISANELSLKCQLEKVIYCKCTNGKEHEFLLLHFRHPTQQDAEAILVSDRIPDPTGDNTTNNNNNNHNNGSSSSRRMQSSRIISPSIGPTPAQDSVFTMFNSVGNIPTYLDRTYGEFVRLTELQFTSARPSAHQLSVLLSVIHQHSRAYKVRQYQCYWYAHTVWEVLKRISPDCFETEESAVRSSYRGLTIDKADSVDEIYNKYGKEWACVEQEAADLRRKEEKQAQQLRMEGQAEERARCQVEIEQVTREKEEAVRRAEEAVRRTEEEAARRAEEAVRRVEEEAARRAEEAGRRAEEEAARRAEEAVRRAEERIRAELQAEIDRMRAQYERHAV
ncbi:hypothetical protein BDR04DRAFT_1199581 [Suillus decipiens]|nr:hypothetical protein BDR04DRAFT_1199581 [Suillus decipiens]